MKPSFFCSLLVTTGILLASCGGNDTGTAVAYKTMPIPGTEIAKAETQAGEDTLNHFKFSVRIVADSQIEKGVYDVLTTFGPNKADGAFTMPKGGEHFIPVIRKGGAPATFIIGFHVPKDTTFYDYYLVSATTASTKMLYMNSYSF